MTRPNAQLKLRNCLGTPSDRPLGLSQLDSPPLPETGWRKIVNTALRTCWCVWLVLWTTSFGCESTTVDPASRKASSTTTSEQRPEPSDTTGQPQRTTPAQAVLQTDEWWELLFVDGKRVGRTRMVRETLADNLIRLTSESDQKMQRFGQPIQLKVVLNSLEKSDGTLLRCSSKMTQGPVSIDTTAEMVGDQLQLRTQTLGNSQGESIPWESDWGGFFVDQESLRRQPMRSGEQRRLSGLVALFNKRAEYELQATELETVELLSGEQAELLRIEGTIEFDGAQMKTIYWTNSQGEPLKSSVTFSGIKTVGFRTSKELALEDTGPSQFDLGTETIVETDRILETPHQTRRVVYEVELANGDPAKTFVTGPSQAVESLNNRTARITVVALRGDQPTRETSDDPPTAEDLRSNNLIQSDDEVIVAMARQGSRDTADPWTLACALERQVRDTVRNTNFSQAMSSAADVARSREGDCTEHAVLLAALCRARKIPARVAVGLVYYRQAGGFAYHMWNEVWIRDRWVALDATLGAGGIGAAHLKITDSSLAGTSSFSALLPVLQVLGDLELRILAVE